MIELAEVVGLEEQLTVPTRNQAHLVDLWIAMRWTSVRTEWTKAFADVAQRHSAQSSCAGSLHVVTMSDRQGWIVARGVDCKALRASDVESLVRGLVAQVNVGIAAPAERDHRLLRQTWPVRLRALTALGGAVVGGFLPASRRRSEADAASGG